MSKRWVILDILEGAYITGWLKIPDDFVILYEDSLPILFTLKSVAEYHLQYLEQENETINRFEIIEIDIN